MEFSEGVTKILQASCSDSTWGQYKSVYAQWQLFKDECKINSNVNIYHILEFLYRLFNSGKGYSCLNTARSALSILIGKIDNYFVGAHPLVSRFMKGVGRLKPPKAKYQFIWDASVVLRLMSSWGDNSTLSLTLLTKKLAVLFALCSGQRVQTFSLITRNSINFGSEDVKIIVSSRLKTSKPGQIYEMKFGKFADPNLCIFSCLKYYLSITNDYVSINDFLFVSTKKPYKSVSSQTLSNWLKSVIAMAGIDTSKFTAHSFRHAATSKAFGEGVHVDEIFKTAGWSQTSRVFANFYRRPVIKDNEFMKSILSSCVNGPNVR